MMTAGLALFNVLVGAALSFLGAWALAALPARLLRGAGARFVLLVLALPFAKAVYELTRGIPADAFFWLKLEGSRQELGSFRIGFGAWKLGPVVDVALGAVFRGHTYPQSGADLLAALLEKKVAPVAPAILGAVLAAIGAVRVGLAIVRAVRARIGRETLARARVLGVASAGLRRVTVYAGHGLGAVPFAGGLGRPFVFVPEETLAALSRDEADAVIAHELAHHRRFDLLFVGALRLVREALWFIPGIGVLARRLTGLVERAADESATATGVARAALASALVRVGELALVHGKFPERALAAVGRPSVLRERVHALVTAPPSAATAHGTAARIVLLVAVAAAVLRATLLGNP
jgi:Zn-dependent protease with chaperone function